MADRIKKAVFPVGGMGTRFLPATKAMPKEMLPVVDKPLIQYAVEEAVAAGIEEFIFVTGRGKSTIEDHFDRSIELESILQGKPDSAMLGDLLASLPVAGQICYTRQQSPLGLGHAVWCARHLVGDEPFAVLLADDLIHGGAPCLKQMVDEYQATGMGSIGVEQISPAMTDRYGIVSIEKNHDGRDYIQAIVEKPQTDEAPSNLGVVGRYILPAEIFPLLEGVQAGVGGEIQLTDAIAVQLRNKALLAHAFDGVRYDCGSRTGFIQATVDYALEHDDLREDLLAHIANLKP